MAKKKVKNRHQALGLTDEDLVSMYEIMLLSRRLDERMYLLNRAGKIPFVVSCQGQEVGQVAAAFALDRDKDYIFPYYRDVGVVLACGMTAKDLMLQVFAKAEDPNSGGRQMPGHFGHKEHRIVTQSSPVTTQIPHAAGFALGTKLEGKDAVSFATFGEGSSSQGDFHEGLNFASIHKLPAVFMCENNLYAISVPLEKQVAGQNVANRAAGYGMPGIRVDGNDPLAVYEVVKEAVDRARKGDGPSLIEVMMYRFTGHSSDDDDRLYRDQEEVKKARELDPLLLFEKELLKSNVLTEQKAREIEEKIKVEIDEATEYAENAPFASPESALKHVYAE